jgi:ABC-type Fe3+ transport system permease subunit
MRYVALAVTALGAIVAFRILLVRNRATRLQIQDRRAHAAGSAAPGARVLAALAWPVFFVFVAVVLVLGVFLGSLVGPH